MKYFIFLLLLVFGFSGCSSKKYFEPKTVAGSVAYNGSVVTPIVDQTRDGVTLADGRVITKRSGLIKGLRLTPGFRYINENDTILIAANLYGDLHIISKDDATVKNKLKFKNQILSATINGNLLAMVDAKNNILLYDIASSNLIYKEKLHEAVALDTRLANPKFINDIIVFPTLDGRLLIMSKYEKRVLRDIAISTDSVFNNVIFLDVLGDTMIAATKSKVISVSPTNIRSYKAGIKDIVYDMGKVYLFTVGGKVILLNDSLQKLNELQLPYAIFSGAFATESKIYAVEKTGYLIEIEKDLSSYKVKKLDGEIKTPVIAVKNKLFIGAKYIILQ